MLASDESTKQQCATGKQNRLAKTIHLSGLLDVLGFNTVGNYWGGGYGGYESCYLTLLMLICEVLSMIHVIKLLGFFFFFRLQPFLHSAAQKIKQKQPQLILVTLGRSDIMQPPQKISQKHKEMGQIVSMCKLVEQ